MIRTADGRAERLEITLLPGRDSRLLTASMGRPAWYLIGRSFRARVRLTRRRVRPWSHSSRRAERYSDRTVPWRPNQFQTPRGEVMKMWTRSLSMSVLLALAVAGSVSAQTPPPSSNPSMPGKAEGAVMRVRGTVSAVDKENKTITLKGPKGRTITFDVQDPTKL